MEMLHIQLAILELTQLVWQLDDTAEIYKEIFITQLSIKKFNLIINIKINYNIIILTLTCTFLAHEVDWSADYCLL